jgi:hypothetical protein
MLLIFVILVEMIILLLLRRHSFSALVFGILCKTICPNLGKFIFYFLRVYNIYLTFYCGISTYSLIHIKNQHAKSFWKAINFVPLFYYYVTLDYINFLMIDVLCSFREKDWLIFDLFRLEILLVCDYQLFSRLIDDV